MSDAPIKNGEETQDAPDQGAAQQENSKLSSVTLDVPQHIGAEAVLTRRDREIALRDLLSDNFFQPLQDDVGGPYDLILSIQEGRLVMEMRNAGDESLPSLVLSLKPYRRLVQDYYIIVQSYDKAVRDGQPSRIEAIDMGRRAVHNEGADLLQERLSTKIEMDFDTARRLFTLICILHETKAMLWRS